jgi:hypothetical protein
VTVGALVGASVVLGEALLGFVLLGRAFDRFDPGRT